MSSTMSDLTEKLSQGLIDIAHHLVSTSEVIDQIRDQKTGLKEVKTKDPKEPRDPDKPKYPKSAYLWYSHDHRSEVKAEINGNASEVMTLLGHRWKALSEEEKQPYRIRAKEAKEQYEKQMKLYNNNKKAKLTAGNQSGGSVNDDTTEDGDRDGASNSSPTEAADAEARLQKPTKSLNYSSSQAADPKISLQKPSLTKDDVTKKKRNNIAKQIIIKGKHPATPTEKHLLKDDKRPSTSTSQDPPSKKFRKSKHLKH